MSNTKRQFAFLSLGVLALVGIFVSTNAEAGTIRGKIRRGNNNTPVTGFRIDILKPDATYATVYTVTANEDLDNDGNLDVNEDTDSDGILDAGEDRDGDGRLDRVIEDTNGNGILDTGNDRDNDGHQDVNEDTNGNTILDPGEDQDNDGKLDTAEGALVPVNGSVDANGDGVVDANDLGWYTFSFAASALGKYVIIPQPRFELNPNEDFNGNGLLDAAGCDPAEDLPDPTLGTGAGNGSLDPADPNSLLIDPVARTIQYISTDFTAEDFTAIPVLRKFIARSHGRILRLGVLASGPPIGLGTETQPVIVLEDNAVPFFIYIDGRSHTAPISLLLGSPFGSVDTIDDNSDFKKNYRFIPDPNAFGFTNMSFELNDSTPVPGATPMYRCDSAGAAAPPGAPERGTIRTFILPVNDLPTAADVTYTIETRDSTNEAGTEISLIGSDIDNPLDGTSQVRGAGRFSAHYRLLSLPTKGVLVDPVTGIELDRSTLPFTDFQSPATALPTFDGQVGYYYFGARFEYRPDPGFLGTDTFTYVTYDGELPSDRTAAAIPTSASALVTINVVPKFDNNLAPEITDGPTITPESPIVNQPATMALTAEDPEGKELTIEWTLPDGTVLTGAEVTHTFTATGPVTVNITVTDDTGEQVSDTLEFTVVPENNQPPVLDISGITVTPNDPRPGQVLTFSITATDPDSDAGSLTATWNFDDGNTGSGFTTTHTYINAGSYTVSVTVSDGQHELSTEVEVTVTENGGTVGGGNNVNPDRVVTFTKTRVKLNFSRTNKDSLQIQGAIPALPANTTLDTTVDVDFGNVAFRVFLNTRGRGRSGNARVQLKANGQFKIQLRKSDIRTPFDDLSLLLDSSGQVQDLNTTIKDAPLQPINLTLIINQAAFSGDVSTTYRAKINRNGQMRR